MEGHKKFLGGGGCQNFRSYKYEAKLEFPSLGRGLQKKELKLWGEYVDIFFCYFCVCDV